MCDQFDSSKIQIRSEYIVAFDFEVFDTSRFCNLFVKYRPLMFVVVGLYSVGIYLGQKWMKDRPAYRLNNALFFWNICLAIFSIIVTIRGYPETKYLLSQSNGHYLLLCSDEYTNYATVFWGMMFALSKFVELGDTAFIILRKQKLLVLHWFHHICMVMGCWICAEYAPAVSRVYFINTFVHSFMYSYYALKALKVKIPTKISMALTLLAITQMVISGIGFCYTARILYLGIPCRLNMRFVYFALALGMSFLALFINFFVRSYLLRGKSKTQ